MAQPHCWSICYSIQDIGMRVFCILLTTKLSIKIWNRLSNFRLKKFFYSLPKSYFYSNFFSTILESRIKILRQKFKIQFKIFIDNLVVSRRQKTASCRRWFSRKLLIFQQKLATIKIGNGINFQNILINRPFFKRDVLNHDLM